MPAASLRLSAISFAARWMSSLNATLNAKRLELLKQAVPKVNLVVMFVIQGNPLTAVLRRNAEEAARAWGMRVELVELDSPVDLDRVIGAAANRGANAVLVLASSSPST